MIIVWYLQSYYVSGNPPNRRGGIFLFLPCIIYAILSPSFTLMQVVNDHDCVWERHPSSNPRTDESTSHPSLSRSALLNLPYSSTLRHIVHPQGDNSITFPTSPPSISFVHADLVLVIERSAVRAPPLLHLEIWKSFLSLFDSQVSSVNLSLLPVLLHPLRAIERCCLSLSSHPSSRYFSYSPLLSGGLR
jgi:hypothetical protein